MRRFGRSGFTLIEILIVVAIVAVLVVVLTGVLMNTRQSGDIGQAENFINNIVPAAMTEWQNDTGKAANTYPRSPNLSPNADYWRGNAEMYNELITRPESRNRSSYVEADSYVKGERDGRPVFLDPWNSPYIYRNYAGVDRFSGTQYNPRTYDLISMGPDGELDTEDDIHNGTE